MSQQVRITFQTIILQASQAGPGVPIIWEMSAPFGQSNPVKVFKDDDLLEVLNELGRDGWVLSQSGGHFAGTGFGPARLFLQKSVPEKVGSPHMVDPDDLTRAELAEMEDRLSGR